MRTRNEMTNVGKFDQVSRVVEGEEVAAAVLEER